MVAEDSLAEIERLRAALEKVLDQLAAEYAPGHISTDAAIKLGDIARAALADRGCIELGDAPQ